MSDERTEAFGRALTEAIFRSGRSQVAIATEAGLSDSTLTNWRAGRGRPHPDDVLAVERALGVEPGALVMYLGYVPAETAIPSIDWKMALLSDPDIDSDLREHLLTVIRLWEKRFK